MRISPNINIYCDETGGDYYDFFKLPNSNLGVVVADASDHGVGSALLMTTARAFMISGVPNFQGPARLAGEINQFLTRDSSKTSRFMSMFFLEAALTFALNAGSQDSPCHRPTLIVIITNS
jgi:sigma-B regulation protein RsbU (phosphoserine phosphatase)